METMLLDAHSIGKIISIQVKLDTSSDGLEEYDFVGMARLRSEGLQFPTPLLRKDETRGHHRIGILTFQNQDQDGEPIATQGTKYIELHIRDVAGVPDRVFHWDLEK